MNTLAANGSANTRIDTKYIVGLATMESQMLILADIEQLMSSQEMELLDSVRH
jgi:purine-binding chemotaxis protein CheW